MVLLFGVVYSGGSVDYDKQDEWTGTCNLAESKKQSPVDVITPQSSSELDGKFVDLSKSYNFFQCTLAEIEV